MPGRWRDTHRHLGRRPIADQLTTLIVQLATDNPTWGYQRIKRQLPNLGNRVAASTIARVLRTHGINPAPRRTAPTWRQFLHLPAGAVLS
ncbi:MAG: IS3 family transposase [Acidimicrobiales bacterium]